MASIVLYFVPAEWCHCQVLLILDAVDALYEGAGSEIRDCLVDLLNDLCRFGEGQLRFLLTSENTLLSGASTFFQNGSEKASDFCARGY